MTITIASGSSGDELKIFAKAMANYYEILAAYLNIPGSNPCPMFEDTISSFDYSVILAEALQGQNDNCTWRTGALVESAHLIVGIQREFTIRQKTKSEYYADSQLDLSIDSNYYDALFPKFFSMYRGTSMDGS